MLSTTGTIFALIAVGYVAVMRGVFSTGDLRVLGRFVVNFALPALIFTAVSSRTISEVLNAGYLLGYLAGSLSALAAGYWWSRMVWKDTPIASTFQAMGMSCANSGFVGYPILMLVMPSVAPTALALNMIVENLIVLPLLLIMAERASGMAKGWGAVLPIARRLATNPIILALLAGLCVSLLGIELPTVIMNPIKLIAASSAAISLIVIGGTLAGLPIRAIDKRAAGVVLGKLGLMPVAVWLGLWAAEAAGFGVGNEDLRTAAILMAATPAMGVYPILAQQYGQAERAAIAMLVMTVLSFFSISAFLLLLI